MRTEDKFKNSPLHDKAAILKMLDEMDAGQMSELVKFSQHLVKNNALLADVMQRDGKAYVAGKYIESLGLSTLTAIQSIGITETRNNLLDNIHKKAMEVINSIHVA